MRKLLGVALTMLLLTGCGAAQGTAVTSPVAGTYEPPPQTPNQPPAANPGAPAQTPVPTPSTLEITVKMLDYSYEPNLITVPVGAHVKLTILNAGQKSHDLNIVGGPSIEGEILKPGESQVMEFTADKAGQFQIVCSQRGHKEKGMVATLVIK